MIHSPTDTWNRILEGDPDAWEELVLKYGALVYSTVLRCGLRGTAAEDCAQNTWLALYTRRGTIKDPSKLPVWLISTAHRLAGRIQRKRASRSRLEAETEPPQQQASAEDNVMRLQRHAILEGALSEMGLPCQQLLRAMFFAPDNPTYEEIARELGIAFNSLGPMRMRCLKKLKEILENFDSL
jgi:RNA polymerase sigma factor (sigma-70 family)